MSQSAVPLLVAFAAAALAAATYFLRGRPPRPLWPAVAGRAVAWGALALLLLNPGCGARPAAGRPLVLLDTSLSLEAAGGRAAAARARADSLGDVQPFAGSRLRPALTAAAASGRPLIVVTDGEVVDAGLLPEDLLRQASVDLLPRADTDDLALVEVAAPRWLPAGDTLPVRVRVRRFGESGAVEASLAVREGERLLAQGPVRLDADGRGEATLRVAAAALAAGDRVLEVVLAGNEDAEPRTDRRRLLVTVMASPGIVLAAAAPDWESRFLHRVLDDVAGVPVRGFVQLEPGAWRVMGSLAPASATAVAEAVRRADLVVTFGPGVPGADVTPARGRWEWTLAQPVAGDWFLTPDPTAPGMAGLAAVPPESLPPAGALGQLAVPPSGTVGFRAQLSRRGVERPAAVAEATAGRRRIVVGASGLWRWAFRGGLAEQAYRVWVAETVSWLLGGSATEDPALRPLRPVVAQDEPVIFVRSPGNDTARSVLSWSGGAARAPDTLAFDGAGRASIALPPGVWPWRATSGDSGILVVEEYSPEFLPAPVTLEARSAAGTPGGPSRRARELPWLFALPALAWCLEWWTRRRAGLR